MPQIKATTRNSSDSTGFLRQSGLIPAVLYGKGTPTTPITVSDREFAKIWKEAGESTIVKLDTDQGVKSTLIHDVQFDAVSGVALHADFLVVDTTKAITINVPIEFTGLAPAVKSGLGTVAKVLHEIEVSALPDNLPHSITVDLSSLENLDSQITIADVTFPTGVTPVTGSDEVVASVAAVKEEVEEAAPIDLSAIEVEKKGKKEEEGNAVTEEAK